MGSARVEVRMEERRSDSIAEADDGVPEEDQVEPAALKKLHCPVSASKRRLTIDKRTAVGNFTYRQSTRMAIHRLCISPISAEEKVPSG